MNVYVVKSPNLYGGFVLGVFETLNMTIEDIENMYKEEGFIVEVEIHPVQTKLEIL